MSTKLKKAVVVISGGMDSTTLLYDTIKSGKFDSIYALSFNYGQRHSRELWSAALTCQKLAVDHKVVDISSINCLLQGSSLTSKDVEVPEGSYEEESMKATVVPNRNMILLSLAIGYAVSIGADTVCYGAHSGDHSVYPDCRPEFVESMNTVSRISNWQPVEIHAPYLSIDKGDIVKKGIELGVDFSLTWTCYKGAETPCGKCGACRERSEAFAKAGIDDPLLATHSR
jgi:7-cyano-7-deazaguanine synthase